MQDQEAPPMIKANDKDKETKEKDEDKKEEPKEETKEKNSKEDKKQKKNKKEKNQKDDIPEKNEIKIEEKKDDTPEKNEIIIEKKNEETEGKKEKKEEKQKKKDRINMDEFEKFMDSYPKNLTGKFAIDFFGDTLKPDCIFLKDGRKKYVFFNIVSLKNILNEKWIKLFQDYPKNLEDLKKPLENFKSADRNEKFQEETGIIKYLTIKLKFLYGDEYYSDDVRERAKAIAYLLAQIEHRKKNSYTTIGMIDSIELKVDFPSYAIFNTIQNEIADININSNKKTESLIDLIEKFQTLFNNIEEGYKNDYEKKILKSFLINEIGTKLKGVEDFGFSIESEEYSKVKSLRNKVNEIILFNIEKENNKNFFFGEEAFEFKVLKDTKAEKSVLINSVNMKGFYNHLVDIFKNTRDFLLQFDDDDNPVNTEDKMKFIKKYMKKVDNLENLSANIKKEINRIKNDMTKNVIDAGKNVHGIINNVQQKNIGNAFDIGKNVADNYMNISNKNVEMKLLEKTDNLLSKNKDDTIKLIKEFDLMEKLKFVEDKRIDQYKINGILISRVVNTVNPLQEQYFVFVI